MRALRVDHGRSGNGEVSGLAIRFHPRAGHILVCDFTGFAVPEMVKRRPVIVVSPRLPDRPDIVTIVPLSTSAPRHTHPYVVRLSRNYHPDEDLSRPVWAKCDMVLNIARWRLDSFKVGKRTWHTPRALPEDLLAVKHGVLHGLGFGHLLKPD